MGSRMKHSNDELVDMLFAYKDVDCNGHVALRLYEERFPHKRTPHHHHTTFISMNRRLRETGSLSKSKMNRE